MKRTGRILRIRPGHLANFSGGAGYMPFIVMFSVPASLLFGIVGSLALHFRGRAVLGEKYGLKTGLHEFARYLRWHVGISLALTAVVGLILFFVGQNMVYGSKAKYAAVTVVFALGPLVAWLLSSFALMGLIASRGAKWTNLLLAAAAHLVLLGLCIPILKFVSVVAGAPI